MFGGRRRREPPASLYQPTRPNPFFSPLMCVNLQLLTVKMGRDPSLPTFPAVYYREPGLWTKVRLAWRSIGLESISGRIELEYSPKKSGQCTCRSIWKRKEISSDVSFFLTADSQTYAAPNWLTGVVSWHHGLWPWIAGATELQRGYLQLSLLGYELASRT